MIRFRLTHTPHPLLARPPADDPDLPAPRPLRKLAASPGAAESVERTEVAGSGSTVGAGRSVPLKVIFLDIDGVMNTYYTAIVTTPDTLAASLEPENVAVLNPGKLIKTHPEDGLCERHVRRALGLLAD